MADTITSKYVEDGADNAETAAARYAYLAESEPDANRKKVFTAYSAMLTKLSEELKATQE